MKYLLFYGLSLSNCFKFNWLILLVGLVAGPFISANCQIVPNSGTAGTDPVYVKTKPKVVLGRKDNEPTNATLIMFGGAVGVPGGDMAARYGLHGEANLAGYFKTKSNWLFGIEAGYLFGEEVKENTLGGLVTKEGYVIGNIGRSVVIAIQERGLKLPFIKAGKLFPMTLGTWCDRQASGLFATAGVGFFQHQIDFNVNTELQFLQSDGARGYDRMCNGLALNETMGYMFVHRNRWVGGYIAVDFLQGFTQSRRYDYDLNRYDNRVRNDLTFGLRLGLMLPLFPVQDNELLFE